MFVICSKQATQALNTANNDPWPRRRWLSEESTLIVHLHDDIVEGLKV